MYNPGISFHGDQYLFQGISSFGQNIADAIKKRDQMGQEDAYNDMVVGHAYDSGRMSEDDYNRYLSASHTKKTGIAAGLAANIVTDWKQARAAEDEQYNQQRIAQVQQAMAAQAEQRQREAEAMNWQPTDEDRQRAQWTGNEIIQTGPGQFKIASYDDAPAAANRQVQIQPYVDPVTRAPVPGMGIVQGRGNQFQIVDTRGGGPLQTETAPDGTQFYRDAKGNPRPINIDPEKQARAQRMKEMMKEPLPSASNSGIGFWDRIMGRGNAGPSPSASPSPTAPPKQTAPAPGTVVRGYTFKGGDPADQKNWQAGEAPPAQSPNAAPDLTALATRALTDPNATEQHKAAARKILAPASQTAEQVRAAYRAGQLTKEDAIKRLKELGYAD